MSLQWWETAPAEPDLDYGDEPDDPNDERDVAPPSIGARTFKILGRRQTEEEREYTRQALIRHKASKGRNPDGSKMEKFRYETDEAAVEITEHPRSIVVDALPRSPKGIGKRAEAAGWAVYAGRSQTRNAPVLYQHDSKEDAADQHAAGEVRYPGEERAHFTLQAHHGSAAFRLVYETRPKGTAFLDGKIREDGEERFVTSATTFAEWFDALVPKPETRKTRDDG